MVVEKGLSHLAKAMSSSRFHLSLTLAWILLLLPTVLWWRESVFWVSLVSIYANIATHWGAYSAAKSEEKATKIEKEMKDGPGQRE